MLTIVKITDIHKLSANDTGYPNIGSIVKFNKIPIIIPIVVDVKLSINASLLFVMFGNGFTGDQSFTNEWRKFELKTTITNYTGAYEYLDIQTIANATYWFKDFKIEEGYGRVS